MMFKSFIILGYLLNCIASKIATSQGHFLAFLILHLLMSSILMACYYMFGYLIYRYTTPRYIMMGGLSCYFSMSIAMLYDQI